MEYYSPLRYPGGKGKIATFFKQVIKDNNLYDGVYIEPYAGGASVGLSLLINQYVSKIIINDIDPTIYAFWHSVLFSSDSLCQLIKDTPVTVETWKKQKDVLRRAEEASLLELGFATFFLNRTNISGILNAGVIGGNNQRGKWKIDARYNKNELIRRVQLIVKYSDSISLYNLDACKLIDTLKDTLPSNSLLYFDPPYYVKGKDLYLNYYGDHDHIDIANYIHLLNHRWIVTYDNVEFIKQLYSKYRQAKYSLTYTANKFALGEEIMIVSDTLFVSSLNAKAIVASQLS